MSHVTSVFLGAGLSKVHQILVNGKNLVTPTYFPAISSAEAQFMLEPLLQSIFEAKYPRILVSTYDLDHLNTANNKKISKILGKYSKNNFVFLDSGTFESYWFNDSKWNFNRYKKQVENTASDFYTSFDSVPSVEQNYSQIEKETFTNIKKSVKLQKNNICISVCHGKNTGQLINMVKKIINSNLNIEMIAMPERDCGKTIEEKIQTVKQIRTIIDKKNSKIILHLLGLGNPITIALLTFSGANSFDSVDWSRWIVNRKTFEFTDLSNLSLLECSCKACKKSKIDYNLKTVFHNLLFYQDFIEQLQKSIINTNESKFLKQILPKSSFSRLARFFSK